MSTTQLFVELLVIGIGGIIWLSLSIAAVFNGSIKNVEFLSNPVSVLLIGGLAYVLGIIIDRLSRGIFHRFENRTGAYQCFNDSAQRWL